MNIKEKAEKLLQLHGKSSQVEWKPEVKAFENLQGDNDNWDAAYYSAGPECAGKYIEGDSLPPMHKQAKRDSRFIAVAHRFVPALMNAILNTLPAIKAAREFLAAHDSNIGDKAIWAADYREKLQAMREALKSIKID